MQGLRRREEDEIERMTRDRKTEERGSLARGEEAEDSFLEGATKLTGEVEVGVVAMD